MVTHTTRKTVTLARDFTLPGLDRRYPPGEYVVYTDHEQLDLSFSAFRRVVTRIALQAGAETSYFEISPAQLEEALTLDNAVRVVS